MLVPMYPVMHPAFGKRTKWDGGRVVGRLRLIFCKGQAYTVAWIWVYRWLWVQTTKVVNHLEERLLDQAQARASYTPLFWGHSRSIPQGMILDVQPLVKSLFCPIRASPNGFFDFEASTP